MDPFSFKVNYIGSAFIPMLFPALRAVNWNNLRSYQLGQFHVNFTTQASTHLVSLDDSL